MQTCEDAAHKRYIDLRDVKYMLSSARHTPLPYIVATMRWLSSSRTRVSPVNSINDDVDMSHHMMALDMQMPVGRSVIPRRTREFSSAGLKRQWSFATDVCTHTSAVAVDDDSDLGQTLTLAAWSDLEALQCNNDGDVAGHKAPSCEAFFADQVQFF